MTTKQNTPQTCLKKHAHLYFSLKAISFHNFAECLKKDSEI